MRVLVVKNMQTSPNLSWVLNRNYKTLLANQRAYAAFNDTAKSGGWTHKDLFKEILSYNPKDVFDPMSGYGTVMRYGADCNVNTIMAELNLPAHLWQVLNIPKYNLILKKTIKRIIEYDKFPKTDEVFEISLDFFGPISKDILINLYKINIHILSELSDEEIEIKQKLALAILLPYIMRLSTADIGDITHVKKGGIVILKEYLDDYMYYLSNMLLTSLENVNISNVESLNHESIYADSSCYDFNRNFSCVFTSPPYPNGVDYKKMFSVENAFLEILQEQNLISFNIVASPTIGTNKVSGRKREVIESRIANKFLNELDMLKLNAKQRKAMKSYYLPYYGNYFADMERAYTNINKYLDNDFVGYFIVTNNSARKIQIPVSNFIVEFWRHNGFNAKSVKERELSHIGTKNPVVRGKTALYTEHVIKVWRGCL